MAARRGDSRTGQRESEAGGVGDNSLDTEGGEEEGGGSGGNERAEEIIKTGKERGEMGNQRGKTWRECASDESECA